MASRKEIRTEALNMTDQDNSQIGSIVNEMINATLLEIANPAWAYSRRKEVHHRWSWLKRKTTLTTVASQEDYILPRDVKDIYLARQTAQKIERVPDEWFYKLVPNPTETGNPRMYRMWGVEGVSTSLAAADTLDVVSSSASDDGDADMIVTIWGFVGGILTSENYTLDGTTTVSGSLTFQARPIFVSKSKETTGTIAIKENSGNTTILTLGTQDRSPVFQVMSFWPIPSSAITVNLHYYTGVRNLTNDGDSPPFDENWHYVIRLGTIAKIYQFLNKEESFRVAQGMYSAAVRSMITEDKDDPDLTPRMKSQHHNRTFRHLGHMHIQGVPGAVA